MKILCCRFLVSLNRHSGMKSLTHSWWRPLSYRNQVIDFLLKSLNWFLYNMGLHHERVRFNNYSFSSFSICHWNQNNITAHSFEKISVLKVHSFMNSISFVWQKHYELFRSGHPPQHERDFVCIFYRNFHPLTILNIYIIYKKVYFLHYKMALKRVNLFLFINPRA